MTAIVPTHPSFGSIRSQGRLSEPGPSSRKVRSYRRLNQLEGLVRENLDTSRASGPIRAQVAFEGGISGQCFNNVRGELY
jgi:hypothetical protein